MSDEYDEYDYPDISVVFALEAWAYENISVICNWEKGRWEQISTQFHLCNPGFYNFQDFAGIFQITIGDELDDIHSIFSIIRQPQSFASYVMQKLYCTTVNLNVSGGLEILDWNVKPNKVYYVWVNLDSVKIYLTQTDMENDTNCVASGIASSDTLQVVLTYTQSEDEYDDTTVDYYYQDVPFHLSLSTLTGGGYFKVKPLTDLSEIRHPIYNNSNIVLSRGEAELNLHTYTILEKELVLGVHIPEMEVGEVVSFESSRRHSTKVEQILSNTITGTVGDGGEVSLINTIRTAEYKEITR